MFFINKKRLAISLLIILIAIFTSLTAFAEDSDSETSNRQNGVELTITTNKADYVEGDAIQLTIKVKNTNAYALEDVNFDYIIRENLIANMGDMSELPTSLETIEAQSEQIYILDVASISETSAMTNPPIVVVVSSLVIVISLVLLFIALRHKKKKPKDLANLILYILLIGSIFAMGTSTSQATEIINKNVSTTTVHEINYAGEKSPIKVIVTYSLKVADVSYTRAVVHDPSIIKVDDEYYVFGSHRAVAKTTDLMNWKEVSAYAGFTETFGAIYKEWASLDAKGESTVSMTGNMWAPDIIYNKALGKYCLYMSLNGVDWNSVIVMATSDSIEGPYTNAQPIVYSGFTNDGRHPVELTDYAKVTGETTVNDRYLLSNGKWSYNYGTNAIDPSVFYDQEGKLWLIYGSWFGGLFMLELEEETGLRDYSVSYETIKNESDQYMGKQVAGGYFVSGEAPYIEYIDGYYYLFITYGGLQANAGYNIRLFRSEKPDGPYMDATGRQAIYTNNVDNIAGPRGVKLFSNYKWAGLSPAYMAGGHNSILTDEDGKIFNFYHTRFNTGNESHQVRVHQLFMNKDGWLVQAPNEYSGETLPKTGYDRSLVLGEYEVLIHETSVSKSNFVSPIYVTLNEDGTVTGDVTGTWTMEAQTPYMSFTYNKKTFNGVFIQQADSTYNRRLVMSFTALCPTNNTMMWGNTK